MKSYADYREEFGTTISVINTSNSQLHRQIVSLAVDTCQSNERNLEGWRALVDAAQPKSETVTSKAIVLFIKRIGLRITKDGHVAIDSKSKFEIGSREWLDDIKETPWYKEKKNVPTWKDVEEVKFNSAAMEAAKLAHKGEHMTDEEIVKKFRAAMRQAQEQESYVKWTIEYDVRNVTEQAA